MAENSPNEEKTLWEKEKLLVTSNFSFSHNVFKRRLLQTCNNQGLFGKGLKWKVDWIKRKHLRHSCRRDNIVQTDECACVNEKKWSEVDYLSNPVHHNRNREIVTLK